MSSTAPATQVAELVRALALGWKNLAAYPPGHPALAGSFELIEKKLADLRGPAGDVALGIETDGLLYAGEKIASMPAQKFAQALYARGVAILRFAHDTNEQDIETFLRILASGTPRQQARPIWELLTAAGVTNINLQPVDYSSVQMTDLEEPHEPSLWKDILRALIEGRELSASGNLLSADPQSADELTQMILRYIDGIAESRPQFDPDATFGVRMPSEIDSAQLAYQRIAEGAANHIATATGANKQNALHQAVQLLRMLPDAMRGTVLRKIIGSLARDDSAGPLLRQFVSALPHDEVLDALRYLSSMGNLSAHALALIESLSALETPSRAAPPSDAVIGDLVRLFGEDDVDRFNPDDHTALLDKVSIHIPEVASAPPSKDLLGNRTDTVGDDAVTRQLARTILDLLAKLGAFRPPLPLLRLEALVRAALDGRAFGEALEFVQGLLEIAAEADGDEVRHAVHASIGRLASGETIRGLVECLYQASPEDSRSIQRLIEVLGAGARRNLLLALTEESNRSRRRRLFDFIASLGPVVVPEVTALLADSRWFVIRNMIVLLRAVNDRSTLPEIRRLAQHADLRVRMEAIKSLFALDPEVPPDLLDHLVRDPDPKVAEAAVTLIGSTKIREGLGPLLSIVGGNDLFGRRRSLRVKAIRALGELGDPAALAPLQRFFSDSLLPWPSREERNAAWDSLSGYPATACFELVELGRRSRNRYIRDVCARLTRS